ncbi:ATP-binding protein [Pseudophaeobacter sp.]|uniref:hybrid sensor histidine kinase/response regulator n=1 Tax=Pseudophaeobacter sp. TaxID=1971739 RepID=UPI003296D519
MSDQNIDTSRFYSIGFAAMALLVVTVSLGVFLGVETRRQFGEIKGSWATYNGEVGQKGAWISSIRGYLGYGGIIHNFKNYVLRRDARYYEQADQQVRQFNAVVEMFLSQTETPAERAALIKLRQTIALYAGNLKVAQQAVVQGLGTAEIDALVRIDDSKAEQALADLEAIWTQARKVATYRIFSAVSQGQDLIGVGFVSIVALILASSIIGTLLVFMLRDMRRTVERLTGELSARRKAEAAETRLASVVEQSPATIVMTDTKAQILYANRRFRELTGWSNEEIIGQTPKFQQSGDTSDETYGDIRTRLDAGLEWQGVFRNRKKDGSTYWADTRILPLLGPDGTVQNFISIGEDITERRQAREQVARAQKLEAVGLLAGGIAHDFNNVLTTIVGAAHLAALDAPEGSDLAAEIEQIEIATKRAQSLVHGLLTFARREPGKPQPVDLCGVVKEVARLLRASLPPTLVLDCSQAENRSIVLADHTKLHQIVMNLARNAAESIGAEEGRITVRVVHREIGPRDLAQREEGWVSLEISDTGHGMSAETRARLFDPFFTTKPLGKGSGLGLVVVAGLVEEMEGRIEVDSAPGEGARFTVYLPSTSQPEASTTATVQGEAPRGHERILLVDDETEISATWRRVLMRLGYRVEAYTSSIIAAEKLVEAPDRYDLLITDMVMPDLSGEELANQARSLRPDLPVLICTGYSPTAIKVAGAASDILAKPVEPLKLARHVRAALDRAVTASTPETTP